LDKPLRRKLRNALLRTGKATGLWGFGTRGASGRRCWVRGTPSMALPKRNKSRPSFASPDARTVGEGHHRTRRPDLEPMKILEARLCDAPMIASVLQKAAEWLAGNGRALWSAAEVAHERVLRDVSSGLFHVARQGEHVAGVMRFELEDAYFWPEVLPGTSAFVHKLAVRRAWAKKGVSTELLSYARTRAHELGRTHLRLDCVADRHALRNLYEGFGFDLHSVVEIEGNAYARYQLSTSAP
jgi:GNAT superfamily N-acetyltransferase